MPLTRYHLPALLLVVAALVAVAFVGLQAWSTATAPTEYRYSVQSVAESDLPADAEVRRFDDLSESARALFEAAQGRDETYVTSRRAPDLQYNDDDVLMDGYNYVVREGAYYNFVADTGGGPSGLVALGRFAAVGLFATVLAGVGLASVRRGLFKLPAALLAGLVAFAGADRAVAVGTAALVAVGVYALAWLCLLVVEQDRDATFEERTGG